MGTKPSLNPIFLFVIVGCFGGSVGTGSFFGFGKGGWVGWYGRSVSKSSLVADVIIIVADLLSMLELVDEKLLALLKEYALGFLALILVTLYLHEVRNKWF